MFAGAGVNWNLGLKGRSDFGSFDDETGDALGVQFRLGYHPGVRVYTPPPPPVPAPPTAPPPANRPPSVRARCEPCTVEIGRSSTVTADAADPDGDALTYRWNAPAGKLASPGDRQSTWTAPMQEGPVPVTIVVNDASGASATDAVTIQVVRPTIREFTFEDVHFDFDRYSLRPEATRALDEVVKTMQENGGVRIEVEGHTCNIGTSEYNLALGDRRATAVREYLTSRGIGANRLRSVSYGEESARNATTHARRRGSSTRERASSDSVTVGSGRKRLAVRHCLYCHCHTLPLPAASYTRLPMVIKASSGGSAAGRTLGSGDEVWREAAIARRSSARARSIAW
jgi:peptidoglycan-associated lipoprotein